MIEYEELRLRLLESEKTVKNLKEALAIDTLKGDIAELEKKAPSLIFGTIWKTAKRLCRKSARLRLRFSHTKMLKMSLTMRLL